MSDFKYDLAFSFVAQDEPLAGQLNDLLQDRLSTFLYSKRQEEIAGTDGELSFNKAFQSESRVVAVLYRPSWGQTPWTRIEETAIRNRAYEHGYDFVVFIPVEPDSSPPPWLPKAQLWVGLERWGVEGAASVLEARVQQAGGQPHPETAVEKAKRLKRRQEFQEQRRSFLSSDAGVQAASAELIRLYDQLEALVATIDGFTMRTQRDSTQFVLYSSGYSLTVAWQTQWRNSLDQSTLWIMFWKGAYSLRGRAGRLSRLKEWELDFDLLPSHQQGWREAKGKSRFFTSHQLADECVSRLLDKLAGQHA